MHVTKQSVATVKAPTSMSIKKAICARVVPPYVPYTPKLLALESRIIMYKRDFFTDGLSKSAKELIRIEIMELEERINEIIADPLEYEVCEAEPWLHECKIFD